MPSAIWETVPEANFLDAGKTSIALAILWLSSTSLATLSGISSTTLNSLDELYVSPTLPFIHRAAIGQKKFFQR